MTFAIKNHYADDLARNDTFANLRHPLRGFMLRARAVLLSRFSRETPWVDALSPHDAHLPGRIWRRHGALLSCCAQRGAKNIH